MRWLGDKLRRPGDRAFTLVELMIAMALVSALTVMIYGLFVRTADSLTDVEGRSVALNQARFGMEFIRLDLQSAGAQATANAESDPWMAPKNPSLTVHGVMGYSEWQNDTSIYGDLDGLENRNPQSAFSGIVVMGAYDIPTSFFVNFADDPPGNRVVVESTERGMLRFLGYDPFDTRVVDQVQIDQETNLTAEQIGNLTDYLADTAERRLLRITDGRGYSQMATISEANVSTHGLGASGTGGGEEMLLTLGELEFTEGDQPAGFDPAEEMDRSFDAAMIDAYWYYVEPSEDDPRNFQLLRQRVDAEALAQGASGLNRSTLESMAVGVPMVIAEYVVDFRIWFDCAPAHGMALSGASWNDEWDVESPAGGCVQDDPASSEPERARIAHIRLSTRTESENANRPHLEVVDGDQWFGFETEGGQMRTYEVYPHAPGSASVVTVQSSVELANFALRDIQ